MKPKGGFIYERISFGKEKLKLKLYFKNCYIMFPQELLVLFTKISSTFQEEKLRLILVF